MSQEKRAVALGFFDGVHIGHGALLDMTRRRAREIGARPTVLSFDVHPDDLVFGRKTQLINSAEDRKELISRLYGIEDVLFLHFDRELMETPWQDFARRMLDELDVAWVVVGHDFSFGYRGQGKAQGLKDYCLERGIGCDVIPAVTLEDRIVSSTYIRELIQEGDVERARRFLGHPHCLADLVRSGYHLGSRMGMPTVNMLLPQGVLAPRYGVYATKVVLDDGSSHPAVTNVGVRPTVSREDRPNVESHILDWSGDLYGKPARVDFYSFIRPERKFGSREELFAQIRRDAGSAGEYFKTVQN